MRLILVLISFFVLSIGIDAQIILERQVLSCFGSPISSTAGSIESTAGEAVTSTITNSLGFITQGFHQPSHERGIEIEYEIFLNECDGTFEVDILSVTGCADADSIKLFWNDLEGSRNQKQLPPVTRLDITSPGGCVYSVVFDFMMLEFIRVSCDLFFYNYLSPNGDGINDIWVIEKIDDDLYKPNHVTITNRWGALVWEGANYDNRNVFWDGRSGNGQNLPDGTYFFKVDTNGFTKSGFVEISR